MAKSTNAVIIDAVRAQAKELGAGEETLRSVCDKVAADDLTRRRSAPSATRLPLTT